MQGFLKLSDYQFKEDGSTDWQTKGVVLWSMLISNSLWQLKNTENKMFTLGQKESIAISILINLAAAIESFTKAMLISYMSNNKEITNSNSNFQKFFQATVENYPFPKLVSLFPTITGSKFSEVVTCSKDISVLMNLRNRLIHGQPPRIAYNSATKELIYSPDYSDICEYLYENVDIPQVQSCSGYHIEFLCFKVLHHFFEVLPRYFNSFKPMFTGLISEPNVHKEIDEVIQKIENRYK